MFGFFSMSASKIAAVVSTVLSKYLLMRLTGEGFNKEKNNVFIDESNNYFGPITANGNSTQGSMNPLSTNVSWFFDGSGDYLTVSDNAAFKFGSGAFTIELWVYPTSLPALSILLSKWNAGATPGTNQWILTLSSAQPTFNFSTDGSNAAASVTGPNVTLNQWNHIAVVRNGNSFTVYTNGVAGTSTTNSGTLFASESEVLGISYRRNNGSTVEWYSGYMSNIRIVKGTAVYTTNFTPPTSSLTAIANTSLLTCQNTYLVDNGPIQFTITNVGDTHSRHFGPFDVATSTEFTVLPSRSVFFGSNGDYLTYGTSTNLALGSGDYTVECWINPTAYNASTSAIFDWRTAGSTPSNIPALSLTASGVPIWYDTVPSALIISTTAVQLNTWTHIAVVRSGTTVSMYLNGVRVGSATSSANLGIQTFRINDPQGSFVTPGYFSNARIVKGTAVYTGNFTPSTSPLTAITNTQLLTCQGGDFSDNSTNNFTVTASGNARIVANSPFSLTTTTTTTTPVTQNRSGLFDGSGDAITTPANANFNISSVDFTIECWVYVTSAGSNPILTLGTGGSAFYWYFQINSNNTITFGTGNGAWLINNSYTTTSTVPLNQWVHLAVVRNGASSFNIYINGVSGLSSSNFSSGSGSAGTLFIGTYFNNYNNDGSWFRGYISDLRIVRNTAVYTANFNPPTSVLTAITNTSLLTCQNSRFIDNSINNLTLSVSGDAKTTMFGPFLSTGSMFFNGSAYLTIPANVAFTLGTGDYTVETWIYPTTITGTFASMIVGTYAYTTGDFGWGLVLNTTGKLQFFSYGTTSGTGINITETGTRIANMWQHVAVTRSGTTVTLWVNGVSVATTTSSKNEDFSRSLKIGTQEASTLSPTLGNSQTTFKGNISNLRIVKGSAVYTSTFTPPTSDLTNIANTSVLILGENNFNDTSSNAFTVTNSATTIQTENNGLPRSPYAGNYSVFLSSNAYLVAPSGASTFGTGDFTIECWIYPTTVATIQYIASNSTGNADNNYWAMYLKTDRTIEFQIRDNASQISVNTLSTVTINSWSHIAVVRSSGNVIIYTNGIPGTATSITKTVTARTTNIGSFLYTGFEGYFAGYISNLRIVTGTAVYRTSFAPSTSRLTAISGTTLLTCQSNRFIDNSSNAYAITISGSPSINNSFTPYDNLYSWYFDGSGDYVFVNHSNAINILSGNFTVECWFNSEVVSGIRPLMAQWNQTSGSEGWMLRLESNNTIGFYHAGATPGLTATLTSSSAANMGTWNHVAVTRNGSSLTMWLNGASVSTATSSGTKAYLAINTTFGTYFAAGGGVPASTTAYYKGWISNARILKGVALYNTSFIPSVAPLSTHATNTGLLTAQNNSISDNSGNLLNITTFGDTRVDPFTPFSNTASVTTTTTSGALLSGTAYFDGTGDYLSIPANDAFIPQANEDFTIEFWWRPTTIVNGGVISPGWNGSGQFGAFVIYLNSSNSRLEFYASSTGSSWDIANATTIISSPKVNQWYHVAVSRRTGSIRTFANGILSATVTSSLGLFRTTLYPLTVGSGAGGVSPTAGYISNLRISRGAGLYANNFTPPTIPVTPLASTSLLLNFRNAGIYDGVGDNVFETLGDTSTSIVQKKNGNSSMFFDGTGDYMTAINPMLAFGTGDFTVEFWMYSGDVSASSQRGMIQTSTTVGGLMTSYNTGIVICTGANRTPSSVNGGITAIIAGTYVGSSGGGVVTTNTWTHVAVVRRSGTATFYLNGTSIDSRTANGNITGTNIAIGGYHSSPYLYNGYLDDLQVFNYAKYTGNFTPT